MALEVQVEKTVGSKGHRFSLSARFACDENFVVLFGPSGAGKTMTLESIAGLARPDRGRIVVGGRVLFDSERGIDLPVRRRDIGYLFQDYALFPHLTVEENVGFGLHRPWQWRFDAAQREHVQEVLAVFELTRYARAYPRQLSGGQRQRTALARALIRKPSLLLLDEPFAALNPLLRARMRAELLEVQSRFRVPVVLITHDQEDVEALADTLVMYEEGGVKSVFPFRRYREAEPGVPLDLTAPLPDFGRGQ